MIMTGYTKVPIFFLLSLCIVFTTPASVTKRAVLQKNSPNDRTVSLQSEFCIQSHTQLFCDFQWTFGRVSLDSDLRGKSNLKSIHIQKVHEFSLDYDILNTDISLAHITNVKAHGERCTTPQWKISLRNTTLEVLTEPASAIYADESHVKNLTLNSLSGQVTVIGSKVDTCRISEVTTAVDVSLKIHSTTIKNFDQLNLTKNGRLLMQSSTIENFAPESLVFDGSQRNLMSGVKFPVYSGDTQAHIILTNGADITLEDNSGAVKIASPPCPAVKTLGSCDEGEHMTTFRNENKPEEEDVHTCMQSNTKLSLALVISLFINLFLVISKITKIATFVKIVKVILKQKPKNVKGASDPLLSVRANKMNNTMMFEKEGNKYRTSCEKKWINDTGSKYGDNIITNKQIPRKRRVTFSGPYYSSNESISDI